MGDTGLFEHNQDFDSLMDTMRFPYYKADSAFELLHGYCTIFAAALFYEFGYPTYAIFDYDGNMVHSFGITEKDELVDVRGITSNEESFFSEFEDEIDLHDLDIRCLQYNPKDFKEEYPELYNMAIEMINQYREWYY